MRRLIEGIRALVQPKNKPTEDVTDYDPTSFTDLDPPQPAPDLYAIEISTSFQRVEQDGVLYLYDDSGDRRYEIREIDCGEYIKREIELHLKTPRGTWYTTGISQISFPGRGEDPTYSFGLTALCDGYDTGPHAHTPSVHAFYNQAGERSCHYYGGFYGHPYDVIGSLFNYGVRTIHERDLPTHVDVLGIAQEIVSAIEGGYFEPSLLQQYMETPGLLDQIARGVKGLLKE